MLSIHVKLNRVKVPGLVVFESKNGQANLIIQQQNMLYIIIKLYFTTSGSKHDIVQKHKQSKHTVEIRESTNTGPTLKTL